MLNKISEFWENIDIESVNSPYLLATIGVLCPMVAFVSFFSKGFAMLSALAISYLCIIVYSSNKQMEELFFEESSNGRISDSESENEGSSPSSSTN